MLHVNVDSTDDMFWNLLAAYIDSGDVEELQQDAEPELFQLVIDHMSTCTGCQDLRRARLAARARRAQKSKGAD
jgi:hypothetical protein